MSEAITELIGLDTFGLPEYRVTEWKIEADGDNIRIACGVKRFGHVEWLYTVVMEPKKLMQCLQECARFASTASVFQIDRWKDH